MADSIRDWGDGTFHYNGKTYYNKNDAEKDRYYDINKEWDFLYRKPSKAKTNNDSCSGCIGYFILIPLIVIGVNFGFIGICVTVALVCIIIGMIVSYSGKKKRNLKKINDAWALYQEGKPTQAFNLVKDLGKDYPRAACVLSVLYYNGQGCEQDYEKAFYYSSLGKKEDVDVYAMYAIMLYYGEGCKKDESKGIYELCAAAAKGSKLALMRLGEIDLYKNNANETTITNLNIAGEDGYNYSYFLLATIYLNGNGTIKQNNEKAFEYMKKAAELGVHDAIDFFENMNNSDTENS